MGGFLATYHSETKKKLPEMLVHTYLLFIFCKCSHFPVDKLEIYTCFNYVIPCLCSNDFVKPPSYKIAKIPKKLLKLKVFDLIVRLVWNLKSEIMAVKELVPHFIALTLKSGQIASFNLGGDDRIPNMKYADQVSYYLVLFSVRFCLKYRSYLLIFSFLVHRGRCS